MTDLSPLFPHAGKTVVVTYGPTLTATNAYAADGKTLRYEIIDGPYKGATADVAFEWIALGGDAYLISWQEADRSTVVHHDDFAGGRSTVFFTTATLDFLRMSGTLRKVD